MNKNKKIVLTIIAVILSTILFTDRVDAKTIMLLNCKYIEQCTDNICNVNSFIRYTDENGNINWAGIYSMGQHDSKFDLVRQYKIIVDSQSKNGNVIGIGYIGIESSDYCWLDDYSNIDSDCSKEQSIGWKDGKTYYDFFDAGICPTGVRYTKPIGPKKIVPAGNSGTATSYTLYLDEPKYIIYQFEDTDGNIKMVAEGYNSDGKYCVIGPNLKVFMNDDVKIHQQRLLINSINNDKTMSFFDVDTNFNNLIISGRGASTALGDKMPNCSNEQDCKDNHEYKVLMDSNDSTNLIKNGVAEWLSTNNEKFQTFEKISNIVSDEQFISELETLNENAESGKTYNFKKINQETMISKIENGYEGLKEAYSNGKDFVDCATGQETSAISSFTSCKIYQEYLGINQISELIKNSSNRDKEHMINQNYIVEMIVNQVNEEMTKQMSENNMKINLLDASRDLKKYTAMFYYAASYMDSNPNAYFLTADQIERVKTLVEKFEALVDSEKLELYPVTSCEGLLGENLINKINSYLNIIKIAVPIILIAFGIVDFTKAVFSENEDSMKKAQKDFIKRLAIAMLIFFVPTILNLLLTLANKVWPIIIPSTCGIG